MTHLFSLCVSSPPLWARISGLGLEEGLQIMTSFLQVKAGFE